MQALTSVFVIAEVRVVRAAPGRVRVGQPSGTTDQAVIVVAVAVGERCGRLLSEAGAVGQFPGVLGSAVAVGEVTPVSTTVLGGLVVAIEADPRVAGLVAVLGLGTGGILKIVDFSAELGMLSTRRGESWTGCERLVKVWVCRGPRT